MNTIGPIRAHTQFDQIWIYGVTGSICLIASCTVFLWKLTDLKIETINPLQDDEILDWSKLKQFADDNFKFDENSRESSLNG